jgi:hypothetical protein
MKPFISTKSYGFLNYLTGAFLFASPMIIPGPDGHPYYWHCGGAILFLPLIIGWLQMIMMFFSASPYGVIKQFPVQMHCFQNILTGSFLIASPFIYDFNDVIWWPHVLCGAVLVILGLFTTNSPFTTPTPHAQPQGGLTSVDYEEQTLMH